MFWRRKKSSSSSALTVAAPPAAALAAATAADPKRTIMGNTATDTMPPSTSSSSSMLAAARAAAAGGNAGAAGDEDDVNRMLSNLSLKGKELFVAQMSKGAVDTDPAQQLHDKRKRPEPIAYSFHKEFKDQDEDVEDNIFDSEEDEDDETASSEDELEREDLPAEIYDTNTGTAIAATSGTVPGSEKQKKMKNRGAWTAEQDEALRAAVERHQGKNWKAIAREVPGNRSHIQCLQRWGKVLKPGLVKGPWTEEEDDMLRKYVPYEPKGNWVAVAQHIPGRTAKQCRERWSLCLDPNIRKDPWSDEEDELLLKLHEKHGNAWAQIAKHLPGRTENATKSRFKSIERKRDRAWTPTEDAMIIRGKAEEKKWSAIAAMLQGARTKHAVKMRWKELMEGDPTLQRFNYSGGTTSDESIRTKDSSEKIERGDSLLMEALSPPIGSSPPNQGLRNAPYNDFNAVAQDPLDETGANWQQHYQQNHQPQVPLKQLPQSLSSDKLMNLKVQRNESFEEWLAKEAGGIASLMSGVTGSWQNPQQPQQHPVPPPPATGSNVRPFETSPSPARNFVMSPSGEITFDDDLDVLEDLDIV